MSATRKVVLDDRGLDYVLEHLSGVNLFCSALAEMVATAPGETWTLMSLDVRGDRAYRFTEGGLELNADASSLRAARIETLLDADADACCIIDDFNARWGDRELEDSPTAFGVGEEVYHLLGAASTAADIAEVLRNTDCVWHGVAAVCVPRPLETADDQSALAALHECARTVVEISCVAYDGEGFVVWRRR
jgi:hypothetical protein